MREILPQTMFLYEYDTIQFSYNVTLYLTVLCRAAPALNQNLRFRAGGALTPIFRLRAALQVHIWPLQFESIYGVESVPPPLSTHIWHSERIVKGFHIVN